MMGEDVPKQSFKSNQFSPANWDGHAFARSNINFRPTIHVLLTWLLLCLRTCGNCKMSINSPCARKYNRNQALPFAPYFAVSD